LRAARTDIAALPTISAVAGQQTADVPQDPDDG
jgi:hypothetical protein